MKNNRITVTDLAVLIIFVTYLSSLDMAAIRSIDWVILGLFGITLILTAIRLSLSPRRNKGSK